MVILGVECTAGPVSCAVLEDGELKAEFYLDIKTTHSQTLMPLIEQALQLVGIKPCELDFVAVTEGPGSFTGVRIGVSAVKGIAQPIGLRCIPVSVLEAMAYNMSADDCYVCAVMDARCNQVYNALFEVKNGQPLRLCEDRALMIDEVKKEVKQIAKQTDKPIFIVGDGALLFYDRIKDECDSVKLAPSHLIKQRASGVCMAAVKKAEQEVFLSAEELLPKYLRLPQAERELRAKQTEKG